MSGFREYLAGDNDGPGGRRVDSIDFRELEATMVDQLGPITPGLTVYDAFEGEFSWPSDLTGSVDGEPSFGSENLP